MAVVVNFDIGEEVYANEEAGMIKSYKQTAQVRGLVSAGGDALANEAVSAVEAVNSLLYAPFSRHATHSQLILFTREFSQKEKMANGTSTGFVKLVWKHEADINNQFIFSGGSKSVQKTVFKDLNGEPITTEHTFADDDPKFPGVRFVQGGEFKMTGSELYLKATGILQRAYPDQISEYWHNSLNAESWVGAPPGWWKCLVADFTPYDTSLSTPKWLFTFAFQKRYGGWEEDVYFKDPRTGKPPADLVPGLGVKTPSVHRFIYFSEIFNVGV